MHNLLFRLSKYIWSSPAYPWVSVWSTLGLNRPAGRRHWLLGPELGLDWLVSSHQHQPPASTTHINVKQSLLAFYTPGRFFFTPCIPTPAILLKWMGGHCDRKWKCVNIRIGVWNFMPQVWWTGNITGNSWLFLLFFYWWRCYRLCKCFALHYC